MTNLFRRLQALLPAPPVLVGRVGAHNSDDTSTVVLPGGQAAAAYDGLLQSGSTLRVRGTQVPVGQNAFVRDGVVESQAPDVEPVDIPIGRVV
jgi:hypothetical protein